jgi:hypothetical protein
MTDNNSVQNDQKTKALNLTNTAFVLGITGLFLVIPMAFALYFGMKARKAWHAAGENALPGKLKFALGAATVYVILFVVGVAIPETPEMKQARAEARARQEAEAREMATPYDQKYALSCLLQQINDSISKSGRSYQSFVDEYASGNIGEAYGILLSTKDECEKALTSLQSIKVDRRMDQELRELVFGDDGVVDMYTQLIQSTLKITRSAETLMSKNGNVQGLNIGQDEIQISQRVSVAVARAQHYAETHPMTHP